MTLPANRDRGEQQRRLALGPGGAGMTTIAILRPVGSMAERCSRQPTRPVRSRDHQHGNDLRRRTRPADGMAFATDTLLAEEPRKSVFRPVPSPGLPLQPLPHSRSATGSAGDRWTLWLPVLSLQDSARVVPEDRFGDDRDRVMRSLLGLMPGIEGQGVASSTIAFEYRRPHRRSVRSYAMAITAVQSDFPIVQVFDRAFQMTRVGEGESGIGYCVFTSKLDSGSRVIGPHHGYSEFGVLCREVSDVPGRGFGNDGSQVLMTRHAG